MSKRKVKAKDALVSARITITPMDKDGRFGDTVNCTVTADFESAPSMRRLAERIRGLATTIDEMFPPARRRSRFKRRPRPRQR